MIVIDKTPRAALAYWESNKTIAIAIPDHTRDLNCYAALMALDEKTTKPIRPIIGLGLHRPMTKAEIEPISKWNPIQHNPDKCLPTQVINGIPGWVNPEVIKAETVISVGVVEPHQYAGFSGGHKGVAIGLGGRKTISALHAKQRILEAGVALGQLDNNPFRETIDRLGQAAGCRHALLYVPKSKVWVFGEPIKALKAASEMASPFYLSTQKYESVRLIVPECKGQSLYQASRAATYLALSPNPPLKKGAKLVIQAELPEGLGSESGFCKALQSFDPPWTELLGDVVMSGAGVQRALMMALTAQNYVIEIIGCQEPNRFKKIGIAARKDIPPIEENTLLLENPFQAIPQSHLC